MDRRWFLNLLGFAKLPSQVPSCAAGGGDAHLMECAHNWSKGPFYVMIANSYEEPGFYPPSAMYQVEHCLECGILRLPEEVRKLNGANFAAGHVTVKP